MGLEHSLAHQWKERTVHQPTPVDQHTWRRRRRRFWILFKSGKLFNPQQPQWNTLVLLLDTNDEWNVHVSWFLRSPYNRSCAIIVVTRANITYMYLYQYSWTSLVVDNVHSWHRHINLLVRLGILYIGKKTFLPLLIPLHSSLPLNPLLIYMSFLSFSLVHGISNKLESQKTRLPFLTLTLSYSLQTVTTNHSH